MIQFTAAPKIEKRPIADLLIWPFYSEEKSAAGSGGSPSAASRSGIAPRAARLRRQRG